MGKGETRLRDSGAFPNRARDNPGPDDGTRRFAARCGVQVDADAGVTRVEWTIVALALVGGIPGLLALSEFWSAVEYASQDYLVPLVALWAATVVPIALAGNLLRVILTVMLPIQVDVEFATEGPLHEWTDVGTYVIGCVCLLAVGEMLRRFSRERRADAAPS